MNEKRNFRRVYRFFRPLIKLIFPFSMEGRENIPEGPALLCANHSSMFDPLLITLSMDCHDFHRHLAKVECNKIPLIGWMMRKSGTIFVRRDGSDMDSVRACLKALGNGDKLMIFPEGTRVKEGESVEPKSGAVYLAVRRQVPLVPIYVPRKKKLFRPVRVRVGQPYIPSADRNADMTALSQDLMARIEALGAVND